MLDLTIGVSVEEDPRERSAFGALILASNTPREKFTGESGTKSNSLYVAQAAAACAV